VSRAVEDVARPDRTMAGRAGLHVTPAQDGRVREKNPRRAGRRHLAMAGWPAPKAAAVIALAIWFCAAAAAGMRAAERPVTVFAAASLRGPLDEAIAAWGGQAVVSYAGSGTLARQILAGAPANIFISANAAWMDALSDEGAIVAGTRIDLLSNRIVLVASAGSGGDDDLTAAQIRDAVGGERIAMGLVEAVPAGIYGKAALDALGLWSALSGEVVQTDNVRSALALVARGEVPYGIVYRTDAALEDAVGIVGFLPEASHPPIVYPMAIVSRGDTPAARGLAGFLASDEGLSAFRRAGFLRPGG